MNTVMTPVFDEETDEFAGFDFDEELGEKVVESLGRNNTFVPNVSHIVYNTKVEDTVTVTRPDGTVQKEAVPLEHPVLATTVYFVDGTKVTVKNSDKDPITLVEEKVKLSDGSETTVKTASHEAKEMGLVYAIVKRVLCDFDCDGIVQNAGFAKFLNKAVGEARVQDVENARMAAERKLNKARAKANVAKAKENIQKKPRGLGDIVKNLAETVTGLKDIVSKLVKDGETQAPKGE